MRGSCARGGRHARGCGVARGGAEGRRDGGAEGRRGGGCLMVAAQGRPPGAARICSCRRLLTLARHYRTPSP